MPRMRFFSSLAHVISHFWPLDLSELLLARAITPSVRLIRVRTRSLCLDNPFVLLCSQFQTRVHK
jgi:hypothetical protein